MIHDPTNDFEKPFEPETPELFIQRCIEEFQVWWDEQRLPEGKILLDLDYATAKAVWEAAYEYSDGHIRLVYEGAQTHADCAHPTGEMYLACVLKQYHKGRITISRSRFMGWVACHENHIRYEYCHDQHPSDPDSVTIWIDHSGQSPSPVASVLPPRRANSGNLHDFYQNFDEWWNQLSPPATLGASCVDQEEARLIWAIALSRLWENLEVVYDSAKAYSAVIAETAQLELGYIIDRYHHSKLGFAIDDLLVFWDDSKYILDRKRTEDEIVLQVHCVEPDATV